MTLATACNSLAAAVSADLNYINTARIMNNSLAAAAQLIELHQYCPYHENYKLTYFNLFFSYEKVQRQLLRHCSRQLLRFGGAKNGGAVIYINNVHNS